ncbi:MAG: hypothetical protein K9L68_11685 [Spirochaetales bacterium]|nr:hypothetical protein [Spirochaetales bacterium]MCF7939250.1 hypothetical protein [Spirochaetales bacterium]
MKKTKFFFGIGVLVVAVLLALPACGGGESDSAAAGSGDKESSIDVPYRVEAEVEDLLSLNYSAGAKIYSITGDLERESSTGIEVWEVKVEYKNAEQSPKQVLDTTVVVK